MASIITDINDSGHISQSPPDVPLGPEIHN